MLANTFSDTKALWKPNMVWFISLQGTNNFTNIWLYWRMSTIVTLHIKWFPFFFFLITLVLWKWKQWFPAASVKTFQMTGSPASGFILARTTTGSEGTFEMGKKKETKDNILGQNYKRQKSTWFGGKSTKDKTKSPGETFLILLPQLCAPGQAQLRTQSTWCWGIVVTRFLF